MVCRIGNGRPARSGRVAVLSAAVAAVLVVFSPGTFAEGGAGPGEARSLDKQLLDDLGGDPLDPAVQKELFSPPVTSKQPGGPLFPEAAEDPLEELRRELGAAAESEEVSPLLDIARRMRAVERLVAGTESGARTQDMQAGIVTTLEQLIAQAKKKCGQCKPSDKPPQKVSSSKPSDKPGESKPKPKPGNPDAKPSRESKATPGRSTARRPDMGQMQSLVKKIWGELPETARQQMLEPLVEEFLPKYELLIEEYFRRLASEQEEGR
jgi:hypothetical protein